MPDKVLNVLRRYLRSVLSYRENTGGGNNYPPALRGLNLKIGSDNGASFSCIALTENERRGAERLPHARSKSPGEEGRRFTPDICGGVNVSGAALLTCFQHPLLRQYAGEGIHQWLEGRCSTVSPPISSSQSG